MWWTELVGGSRTTLSVDERERADRFHHDRDRRRFVAGRTWLREMLGSALGADPTSIRFSYGRRGKPRLAFPPVPLEFSLSHSGEVAVLATSGRPVGVDVELLRPGVYDGPTAETVLSVSECAAIRSSVDPDAAFLRAWTRKEAFVKVSGDGLERDLVDITLTSGVERSTVRDGIRVTEVEIGVPDTTVAVAGAPDHAVRLWGMA